MNPNDLDDIDIKEELDFNDGIGNALSQKQKYKFSWKKTLIVMSVALVFIIFFTLGILEIGKILLNMNESEYVEEATQPTIESVMAESSTDTWDAIPEETITVSDSVLSIKDDQVNVLSNEVKPLKEHESSVNKDVQLRESKPNDSVKVQTIKNEPAAPVVAKKIEKKSIKTPSVYRVIAGSFSTYNNANRELKRIKAKGFNGYVWSLTNKNGVVTYKVQVAAFSSKAKAQNFVETLKKRNISSFISVN
ncbi:MAG: SPOR domain-containing protein [Candidatus Margulisiibacteriota bacterium]|nr:SPOR domain-containing protein [Candidatus Margulisiibacteriota bacterium]